MANLLTGGLQVVGGLLGLSASRKSAKKQAALLERMINEILKSPYQRLSPFEQGVYQSFIDYVNKVITGQEETNIADIYLGRAIEALNLSFNQMLGQTLRGIKAGVGGRLSSAASSGVLSQAVGNILPKLYAKRQAALSAYLGQYAQLRQREIETKGRLGISASELMASMKSPQISSITGTVPSVASLLTQTQQTGAEAFSSILSGIEKFSSAGFLKNVFSPQPQIVPAQPTIKEYRTTGTVNFPSYFSLTGGL